MIYSLSDADSSLPFSILSFSPDSGTIVSQANRQILLTTNGADLTDGVYQSSIQVDAQGVFTPYYFPVTINVDYTPPLAVSNLELDALATDANQIGITWTANAVADSVVTYKIYRKGRDEASWRLMGTVPQTQLWFIDSQFTGLDSTYVYYRVRAEDWVGNLGPEGTDLIATLERFLAPNNVQIDNINNRDIHLSWNPVIETISGLPGTPSCYLIYKSQSPSPLSEFDFLAVSFEEEYTHQWALYFQPLNRLFYIVTAYGGNMSRMNDLLAEKRTWKYGELESVLQKSLIEETAR